MKRKRTGLAIWGASALFTVGVLITSGAFAQRASVPKAQDKIALGESEVKQLLLLMDTDKNGKISRKEFMDFMAAEFDRLDVDKSGELDVNELTKSRVRVSNFTAAGK
jgi:Ca2+-binding EF-hand superfamily protein